MARDVLFRGKAIYTGDDVDRDGQWVYGYFVNCASRYDDPEKDRVAEIIELDADRVYAGEYAPYDTHKVIPETVSQWTGLVDKNGVKIFEGDVVRSDWGYEGLVDYEMFIFADKLGTISDDIEVVGNKWDDPKLVDGSRKKFETSSVQLGKGVKE